MTREEDQKQLRKLPPELVGQVEKVGAIAEPPGPPPPGMMKIDLHCHSEASPDCSTPLDLIPGRCIKKKIRIQAITDHNTIWGAQQLKASLEAQAGDGSPQVTIIIGEEISTSEGELVGLFLQEKVEGGLTPEETVRRIKEQGGIVLLPHGFDPLKRWRLKSEAVARIADDIDVIETFNARVSRQHWNQAAVLWAKQRNCLMSAGSDAHTLRDIGSAWVDVPSRTIREPRDLVKALEGGVPAGDWTHPLLAFMYKSYDRTRLRLSGHRRRPQP